VTCKTVVVLDNAKIHEGAPMQARQKEWEAKGLHLLYFPPYSPEFNAIEILSKQPKYSGRCFVALTGLELQQEVKSLLIRHKFVNLGL
jgi:transposase